MNTHTHTDESSQDWRFKSSRAQALQISKLCESGSKCVANDPSVTKFYGGEQLPQRGSAGWFYGQNLTHPRAAEAGSEAQWMRPMRTI